MALSEESYWKMLFGVLEVWKLRVSGFICCKWQNVSLEQNANLCKEIHD